MNGNDDDDDMEAIFLGSTKVQEKAHIYNYSK